jgi:GNAT superfamily N-acetyltransferase
LIKKKSCHPPLKFEIYKVPAAFWSLFRDYHYLNTALAPFCSCFAAFLQDVPVAFIAVQPIKFKTYYYRVSRLVVLPDYQGIGLGRRLLTWTAEYYKKQSHMPFRIVTSNPQLVRGFLKGWHMTRIGHGGKINNSSFCKNMKGPYLHGAERRLTVSLEYLGNPKS